MKKTRYILCLIATVCMSQNVCAQYDTDYSDDLGLYYDEDEPEDTLPPHKEYKNMLYAQYSSSRYLFRGATPKLKFQEIAVGYARIVQVQEKTPLFVDAGIQMKYSHSKGDAAHQNASYDLLSFRIPINVSYKWYPSRTRDIALAPFVGVNARALATAREKLNGTKTNLMDEDKANTTGVHWEWGQVGWQAGLRFWFKQFTVGAVYGRDFHDKSKLPRLHECSVTAGYCF